MRYWTRWVHVRYELSRCWERLLLWVVWHLPRTLVKWCYIRVGAHATTGEWSSTVVPELSMMDALKRWDET